MSAGSAHTEYRSDRKGSCWPRPARSAWYRPNWPPAPVAAAAHDLVWDADRERWACDIVLPPGRTYQPFVSLSLARYQPQALRGVELSPVASVEWAQLAPDRIATVVKDPLDLMKITVAVAGQSAGGTAPPPNRPTLLRSLSEQLRFAAHDASVPSG